jgi:hypothetical protein
VGGVSASRRISYHEAAHAVVADVIGGDVTSVLVNATSGLTIVGEENLSKCDRLAVVLAGQVADARGVPVGRATVEARTLAAHDRPRAAWSSDTEDAAKLLCELCGSDRRRARREVRRAIATVEAVLRAHCDDWRSLAAEAQRTARGHRTARSRFLHGARVGYARPFSA